jgi:hypothetical protein
MTDESRILKAAEWFGAQGWDVIVDPNAATVTAIMPSGYGEGAITIDVAALVAAIAGPEL